MTIVTMWAEIGPSVVGGLLDVWRALLHRHRVLPSEDSVGRADGQLTSVATAVEFMLDQTSGDLDQAGRGGRRLKADMIDLITVCRQTAEFCHRAEYLIVTDESAVLQTAREHLEPVLVRCRAHQRIR